MTDLSASSDLFTESIRFCIHFFTEPEQNTLLVSPFESSSYDAEWIARNRILHLNANESIPDKIQSTFDLIIIDRCIRSPTPSMLCPDNRDAFLMLLENNLTSGGSLLIIDKNSFSIRSPATFLGSLIHRIIPFMAAEASHSGFINSLKKINIDSKQSFLMLPSPKNLVHLVSTRSPALQSYMLRSRKLTLSRPAQPKMLLKWLLTMSRLDLSTAEWKLTWLHR